MNAGRDFDILIAEDVMGWKVVRYHRDATTSPYILDDGSVLLLTTTYGGGYYFAPSTDIEAAMTVLRKFDAYSIAKLEPESEQIQVKIGMAFETGTRKVARAYAPSFAELPLAICRAAYEVVNAKEIFPDAQETCPPA